MDEFIVDIDQLDKGHVVLAIPSLRLIVMGRTLEEARARARSAIAYRGVPASHSAELLAGTQEAEQRTNSHAA